MMAITFDLPVLGPNSGGFLDIETSGCGITFDNTSDDALYEKMLSLVNSRLMSTAELIKAKQELLPLAVSDSFFSNIKQVVN